jgi:hypothetical protein
MFDNIHVRNILSGLIPPEPEELALAVIDSLKVEAD